MKQSKNQSIRQGKVCCLSRTVLLSLSAALAAVILADNVHGADPSNVLLGPGAGASITTGLANTAIGDNALNKDTAGDANTAIGDSTRQSKT
jgi:hypothetical protein